MDELWLERMAEVLCCDKDPAAVVVAVKDLQDQLASAKRMIAQLRGVDAKERKLRDIAQSNALQSSGRMQRALTPKTASQRVTREPLSLAYVQ